MYVDGFVAPVPKNNKEKYIHHLKEASEYFKNLGATRMVETWQDDVPRGKINDFYGAVQAKDDEVVVFSWIEWPSKEVRDKAMEHMTRDENINMEMPFDGKRMIYGGFNPIFDEKL